MRDRLSHFKVVGSGGYQSLMTSLKEHLEGDQLEVSDDLLEKLQHYAFDFGSGGWQTFLRQLVTAIESATTHA